MIRQLTSSCSIHLSVETSYSSELLIKQQTSYHYTNSEASVKSDNKPAGEIEERRALNRFLVSWSSKKRTFCSRLQTKLITNETDIIQSLFHYQSRLEKPHLLTWNFVEELRRICHSHSDRSFWFNFRNQKAFRRCYSWVAAMTSKIKIKSFLFSVCTSYLIVKVGLGNWNSLAS